MAHYFNSQKFEVYTNVFDRRGVPSLFGLPETKQIVLPCKWRRFSWRETAISSPQVICHNDWSSSPDIHVLGAIASINHWKRSNFGRLHSAGHLKIVPRHLDLPRLNYWVRWGPFLWENLLWYKTRYRFKISVIDDVTLKASEPVKTYIENKSSRIGSHRILR